MPTLSYPARPVWSKDDTAAQLHAFSGAMSTEGVTSARPTLVVTNITDAELTLTVYFETSNDGISWGSATQLGAISVTTNGTTVDSAYDDISADLQGVLYWRLLVRAINTTSDVHQLANVALRVDVI